MIKKLFFIMDFTFEEVQGGAELNTKVLAESISEQGIEIEIIKSINVNLEFLQNNQEHFFIFGNFILLSEEVKNFAINNLKYMIYEQDHKYLKTRNPIFFKDFKAPKEMLTNLDFYSKAKKVLFLTKLAKDVFVSNTGLNNVHNLGCSIWSKEDLQIIRENCNNKKKTITAILDSDNPIKKKNDCIEYCIKNNLSYELIKDKNFHNFIKKLSYYESFVFYTGHLETCARILVEAKMLNVKIIYQKRLIGAASEEWFKLSGENLINKVEELCNNMPKEVLRLINDCLEPNTN